MTAWASKSVMSQMTPPHGSYSAQLTKPQLDKSSATNSVPLVALHQKKGGVGVKTGKSITPNQACVKELEDSKLTGLDRHILKTPALLLQDGQQTTV